METILLNIILGIIPKLRILVVKLEQKRLITQTFRKIIREKEISDGSVLNFIVCFKFLD